MKSFIIILIFLSFCGEALNAQTYTKVSNVKTPNNSIVQDTWKLTSSDIVYTPAQIAALAADLNSNYNGAELVEAPSYKYNCHAYAWHVSEGGDKVWMGRYTDDAEDIYWTDDSYIEVPEKIATKVSYHRDGNHSAIRLNSNLYESKWGWGGPLVKHGPNDVFSIYQPAKTKKYYVRKPSISGPTSVCNQATYTVENLPAGATVQWSTNNNSLQLVSGQGTKTVVFRKNGTGENRIHAKISAGSVIREPEHAVWVGPPHPIVYIYGMTPGMNVYPGQEFTLTANTGTPLLNYRWNIYNGTIIEGFYNSPKIKVKVDEQTYGSTVFSVGVSTWNSCGNVPEFQVKRTIVNNQSFTLSPNPATDAVILQLMETDEVSGSSVLSTDRSAYEIQLWSGMRMLRSFRTNEPTFQIPMAGLPAGLYFVRVVKDGQTYTQKLIKK